jgi:hypothetical protein
VIRSCCCSTRSTISENLALTSARGRTSDMTRILVRGSPVATRPAKSSTRDRLKTTDEWPDHAGLRTPNRSGTHLYSFSD